MNTWDFYALFAQDYLAIFLDLDMGFMAAADDVWAEHGRDAAIVFMVGA